MIDYLKRRFYYGWIIVAVIAAAHFTEVGEFNPVLAVFMKPMIEETGWSRAQVSLGITFGSLLGAILSPLMGPVVDRYGPRFPMTIGQLLYGGCLALTALVHQLWHFYMTYSLGRGLVLGGTSLSASVAVSNWFVYKRGRALGVTSLGSRIGQAILPVLCQLLILARGWRTAWTFLGALVWLVAVVPSFIFLRRRPEDMGLRPDGEPPDRAYNSSSEKADFIAEHIQLEPSWELGEAVRTRSLWLLTLAVAQGSVVGAGINLHLFPYLTDTGIPAFVAVGTSSVLFVTGGVGGLAWGYLAEKFSPRVCAALCYFLLAASVVVLMQVRGIFLAYTFALLYGFALGGANILVMVIIAHYFGRHSLGAISGFIAPFQLVTNASGPFLAGLAYDLTGGYQPAFVVFTVSYLLATVWMLIGRPPRARSEVPALKM